MRIHWIGGTDKARSVIFDGQECINLYPEIMPVNGKNRLVLMHTAGLKRAYDLTSYGLVRGMWVTGSGRCFAVVGRNIVELYASGLHSSRGEIDTIVGHVSMADNLYSLMVVDGKKGYYYNLQKWPDTTGATHVPGVLETIDQPAFPKASHVVFLGGFFVVNDMTTGRYWFSKVYDSATWDAIDFAFAEGSSDKINAIVSARGDLWFLGSKSMEVWSLSGNVDLPFVRYGNAVSMIGTDAPWSVASSDMDIMWLGSNAIGNRIVFRSSGYTPQRISTHAIEYELSQIPRIENATGMIFQMEGHVFYQLNFPNHDKSFVYDTSTDLWHHRAFWNINTGNWKRHMAEKAIMFGDKLLVSDHTQGYIYEQSLDYFLDDDQKIRRIRTSPHLNTEKDRNFYESFDLDIETGVATIYIADGVETAR